MTTINRTTTAADAFEALGRAAVRWGLVLVLLWIGGMKFTAYEAAGIRVFAENSPLTGWAYNVLSERQFSAVLGAIEILVGVLIALRPWSPRASVLGGAAAAGMFLTTLSFLATTPGAWEPSEGGFPAASVLGQFLLKDAVLLGASVWVLADAWRAAARR